MTLGDREHKTALFDQFARVGKALASGKRLELLDLLAQGERDVASLAAAADLGVTTASAHLQTLRQANLVTTRRDGTRILYSLAGRDVADLFARLREVAQSHLPDVEAARVVYLGDGGGRPVTRDELQQLAKTTTVTVLDVRPPEEYTAGHIPDAISIPPGRSSPTAAARTACSPTTPSGSCAPTAATPPAWKTACSNGAWPTCPSPPDSLNQPCQLGDEGAPVRVLGAVSFATTGRPVPAPVKASRSRYMAQEAGEFRRHVPCSARQLAAL